MLEIRGMKKKIFKQQLFQLLSFFENKSHPNRPTNAVIEFRTFFELLLIFFRTISNRIKNELRIVLI